ncbi:uncharacterized protein LOC134540080 isoform X3 [Bacillus rossius redtenbacheri]|uniref:uncharacterized protein LOC134540080 isoform X3 n=1 Tax=Bacillus rossius redtenbacheri TaxID=93214 RepID=UPI002FDEDF14
MSFMGQCKQVTMATDDAGLTKQQLQELLAPALDKEGSRVEDVAVRYLTKPGDNYGSTMLSVDVTLAPGPRTLHLVAKMLPKSAVMKEWFKCEVTVRKEMDLYLLVSPVFERIQRECHVPKDKFLDVFPVCYAARTSSKGASAPVDETSIIVQENLKVQGFECGDRLTGLDLAHCELVVDRLARFHATAVAIKIKRPEEFKETVLRAATPVAIGPPDMDAMKPLQTLPEYESMKSRIDTAVSKGVKMYNQTNSKQLREPFATITHLDLWTNNIMFRYEPGSSREKPTSLKLVDFQVTGYDSPARDLLFFLYSSAKLEVLSGQYDHLVKLYHASFVDCLQILGCDSTPFSFEAFLKELEASASMVLWQVVFMLIPITTAPEDAVSTDSMSLDDMKSAHKVSPVFTSRARKIISDFASRNWI